MLSRPFVNITSMFVSQTGVHVSYHYSTIYALQERLSTAKSPLQAD